MPVVSRLLAAVVVASLAAVAQAQPVPQPPPTPRIDFRARELSANVRIRSKLQQLRRLKAARGWTFDPVYTTALDRDLGVLAGAKVPPNFKEHVAQANARALEKAGQQHRLKATNACSSTLQSFDWRQHAGATPVRDQGGCGSCWIFGAHGALEGSWFLTNGAGVNSSEQNTLDCNLAQHGCAGGWPAEALDYMSRVGSATEDSYGYTGSRATCRAPPIGQPFGVHNWGYVSSDDGIPSVGMLKVALCHYGPISVAVNATAAFQAYGTNQVFNERAMGEVNHAVTLIGWDDAKRAWLIKNSWGTGWGDTGGFGSERGYMWIDYGSNKIGYGAIWTEAKIDAQPQPLGPLAVEGTVHLQDHGDVALRDATWAGTIAQGRRLEGFSVKFSSPPAGVNLEYMCHLQDYGDTGWAPAGTFCGTRDQGRRLEGFGIRLGGAAAAGYDVWYACHVQDLGDIGPFKNGDYCGTRGQGRRVEAMQVWVTPKPLSDPGLAGLVHLQNLGDMPLSEGVWAGTKGQGRRMEGFQVALASGVPDLSLEYMCHVQGIGDVPWMTGGGFCGTRGQGRRVEGLAVRLAGANASKYEVSYSCHVAGVGDLGPFKNGAFCGTRGQGRQVEAVHVVVKKLSL